MRINVRQRSLRFICASLTFVCILFNSLPLFAGQKQAASADLVFCPLQKIWVARNAVSVPKITEPLGGICASAQSKETFFLEASANLLSSKILASKGAVEKLFFSYAQKGKRAFAEIAAPSPSSPEKPFASAAGREKSASGNYKKNFHQAITVAHSPKLFPRPPTFQIALRPNFGFAQKLEKISRRLRPRAPPLVI